MHTLLDLRGNIPSFIHVSDGKYDVHALDLLLPEAGAIYVMDRGYVDFARLHVLHLAGAFFVTRAKSNMDAHRVYSAATDRTTGIILVIKMIALDGHYTSQHYPEHLRRIRFRDTESRKNASVPHQPVRVAGHDDLRALQKPLAGRTVLQMDQTASADQTLLWDIRKNRVKTQIWIAVSVYVLVAIVKKRRRPGRLALHIATDPLGHPVRETAHPSSTYPRRSQMRYFANN